MRKNTEAQTLEKLLKIQDQAMALFTQKGIDKVSVMDICLACNITKPTFYKYIDSKEKIILHYFNGALVELEELWARMDNTKDHVGRILMACSNSMKKAERSDPDLFKQYISYCLKEHRPTLRYTSPMVPKIVEEIRLAQQEGQILNPEDPALIYLSLRNMGLGLCFRWITVNGNFPLIQNYYQEAMALLNVNPDHIPFLEVLS